jgi:hypothetical protein
MARTSVGFTSAHVGVRKKTSIGGNPAMMKMSSMNKSKKSGYKKYRGQGR